jgi:hypothetical protein
LNQRRCCRDSRRQPYAMKKIPTFDILCHRLRSWFVLSSISALSSKSLPRETAPR